MSKIESIETEERILKALKKRLGTATAGDISGDTGLPYDKTENALEILLRTYKSHIDVDDQGNLRYRFDRQFKRRRESAWIRLGRWMWKALKWLAKGWILVVLIGYTAAFIVILVIAAIVATLAIEDEVGLLPLYLLARILELLFWVDIFSDKSKRTRFHPARRKKPKPSVPFYKRVFNFVMGPEAGTDPLDEYRNLAAFIRQKKGRITASDWVAHTGVSLVEADRALTTGILRFGGDVEITESGALLYRFEEFLVSAEKNSEKASVALEPIWSRKPKVPPLTGNPLGSNIIIVSLNSFIMLMAGAILYSISGALTGLTIGLGIVPLVFGSFLFITPLFRIIRSIRQRITASREGRRRETLQKIFENATKKRRQLELPSSLSSRIVKELIDDYEGDLQVLEDGAIKYSFDKITDQLEAGQLARETVKKTTVFGTTVFSSDPEELSLEQSELEDFEKKLKG